LRANLALFTAWRNCSFIDLTGGFDNAAQKPAQQPTLILIRGGVKGFSFRVES